MDVLLINPPWPRRKGNIWSKIAGCVPPLGLAQLASYLEKRNVVIKILDSQAEKLDLSCLGNRLRNIKSKPSFIGITATTSIFKQALAVGSLSKEIFPLAKVVFGGIHPSVLPEDVLSYSFSDYVIRGEGEETFWELISEKNPSEILGLSYRCNGIIIHNAERPLIENLDDLPFPAYHLLPMDKYYPALGSYKQLPGIGLITTRGCPGRCTFCFGRQLGTKIRMRSAGKIVEEIKLLQKNYKIKEISFYDDTFTAFKKNVIEFCNLLINNNVKISWTCFARVDTVYEDLLILMKMAGCHQICYGIESGNEQILQNIKKKISLEKAKIAINLTKQTKIEVRVTFMLGNPGETIETMEQSLKFAYELDPDIVLFNITTPYPGTEMYAWALSNEYIKTKDWCQYDLAQQVMDIPGLKPEELKKFYRKAYLRFYTRPQYLIKRLSQMTSVSNLKASLKAFRSIWGVIFGS